VPERCKYGSKEGKVREDLPIPIVDGVWVGFVSIAFIFAFNLAIAPTFSRIIVIVLLLFDFVLFGLILDYLVRV
jgi:hypothetical protein